MLALSVACTAAAVAWACLLIGHGGYWRTGQRLPPARAGGGPSRWPDVVAVIPARNEAGMLPAVLPTLLGQDYPGALTVVLVDDCSTDGTAEVAAGLAKMEPPGRPGHALRVVAGAPPPPGWAGKVWAMAQGLAAAGDLGTVEYVLFTDADIAWEAGALRALVRAAEGGGWDLVSQMALLRTATRWERVVVPAFVYFFAQLYPFPRVNSPRSRTAAAAGGCMLVRRSTLEQAGGLVPISAARIDDVALGQVIKRQRGRTWLGLSTAVVSVRPYPRLADLWHMVARSAYIQLRYSPWLLAGTVAGLAFLYVLPPAGAVAGLAAGAAAAPAAAAAAAGLAGWALMSLSYLPMLRLYRLSPLRAPGLPLIAMLYAAMTVDSARRHYAGDGAEWKGRTDRAPLLLPRGRHAQNGPAVGGPAGERLAPLPHRRRLHRHPARGQPAPGLREHLRRPGLVLEDPDLRAVPRGAGGPGHRLRGRAARGPPGPARADRLRRRDRDQAGRGDRQAVTAVRAGRRAGGWGGAGAGRRVGGHRRPRRVPAQLTQGG
jgi:hopene-associated glycosyltransferase HpnB